MDALPRPQAAAAADDHELILLKAGRDLDKIRGFQAGTNQTLFELRAGSRPSLWAWHAVTGDRLDRNRQCIATAVEQERGVAVHARAQ